MIFIDFRLYKLLKDLVDFGEFSKNRQRGEIFTVVSGAPGGFIFHLRALRDQH